MRTRCGLLLLAVMMLPLGADKASAQTPTDTNWKETLLARLPLYGHRNWIVVADSAYPAQSRDGIETIVSNADQMDVLKQVLSALDNSKHVTPIVYTDRELKFLEEKEAPGITAYREQLAGLLEKRTVNTLSHEQIIAMLDSISQTFRVLIIKTNLTIPYTSVFLQLDCAYWNADQERKLRARIGAHTSVKP